MTKKIIMFILVAGLLTACGSKNEELDKIEEVVTESINFKEEIIENPIDLEEMIEEIDTEDKIK